MPSFRPPPWRLLIIGAVVLLLQAAADGSDSRASFDAFVELDPKERRTLDSSEALVRVLPSKGRDIALVGVVRTNASGDRLVERLSQVEDLYQGRYIPLIGRFSNPPRLEDLAALELDDRDLDSLRQCEVADCDLKLSASEMSDVRSQISAAGGGATHPLRHDFLYWSKQELGVRPVVAVTHLMVVQWPDSQLAAVAAAKQVFATHYLTASLSFTAIATDESGAPAYLLYENRSRVDFFDGAFAGLRRLLVERRLRSDGPRALEALRRKLESGDQRTD